MRGILTKLLHVCPARSGRVSCLPAIAVALAMSTPQAAATTSPAEGISLACRLAVSPRLARTQTAVLTIALTNAGTQPVHLLRRNTPLEGWFADSLTVTRDGQPVPYAGPMAKRPPPEASEYVLLKSGKTRTSKISLQGGYDVSKPGDYIIVWNGNVMDARVGLMNIVADALSPLQLACADVRFTRER